MADEGIADVALQVGETKAAVENLEEQGKQTVENVRLVELAIDALSRRMAEIERRLEEVSQKLEEILAFEILEEEEEIDEAAEEAEEAEEGTVIKEPPGEKPERREGGRRMHILW